MNYEEKDNTNDVSLPTYKHNLIFELRKMCKEAESLELKHPELSLPNEFYKGGRLAIEQIIRRLCHNDL